MYSQNNEEEVVVKVFGEDFKGKFLDIGAYTGKELSNSYRLTELGWKGICVEPSPFVFTALLNLHKDNPGIELLNIAISPEDSGPIQFWDSMGDAVSTSVPEHRDKWLAGSGVKYGKYWVQPLSVAKLFEIFGTNFDFITLDVESMNIELFRKIPFSTLSQLKCFCIEHDGHENEITETMKSFKFQKIAENAENAIYAL